MAIKIFALLKRRPDLTREQFQEYWGKNHSRIFSNLPIVKQNIVRYTQFHILGPPSDLLAAAGVKVAPYDGASEFIIEKLEDMFALFTDEEYLRDALPDIDNFVNKDAMEVMVGEDQLKWLRPSASLPA